MANNNDLPVRNGSPIATRTPLAQAIQNPGLIKQAPVANTGLPQQNRILNLPFTYNNGPARK
jgi:hypothetical protein